MRRVRVLEMPEKRHPQSFVRCYRAGVGHLRQKKHKGEDTSGCVHASLSLWGGGGKACLRQEQRCGREPQGSDWKGSTWELRSYLKGAVPGLRACKSVLGCLWRQAEGAMWDTLKAAQPSAAAAVGRGGLTTRPQAVPQQKPPCSQDLHPWQIPGEKTQRWLGPNHNFLLQGISSSLCLWSFPLRVASD